MFLQDYIPISFEETKPCKSSQSTIDLGGDLVQQHTCAMNTL